jgi:hypothetical protein
LADALKFLTFTLRRGIATGEMGFSDQFAGSNPEPLMSAMGQKQTLERLHPMSALPPKADMADRSADVRFVPQADSR